MHSYGGQVGTNALYGLGKKVHDGGDAGGVSHLIYLSAFALPAGGSMIGVVKEFNHMHLMPIAFDFAEDDSCVCFDPKSCLIGSGEGASGAEIETYLASLVRWNGKCMYQEITNCAWADIPASYLYTSEDMTVPVTYQKWMVEKMEEQGRKVVQTVELTTGHSPNLTQTQEVVDFVNQVAAGSGQHQVTGASL